MKRVLFSDEDKANICSKTPFTEVKRRLRRLKNRLCGKKKAAAHMEADKWSTSDLGLAVL